MTRMEWLSGIEAEPLEQVFRIARGCQNCGFYVPDGSGAYVCIRPDLEKTCREEHAEWLKGEME